MKLGRSFDPAKSPATETNEEVKDLMQRANAWVKQGDPHQASLTYVQAAKALTKAGHHADAGEVYEQLARVAMQPGGGLHRTCNEYLVQAGDAFMKAGHHGDAYNAYMSGLDYYHGRAVGTQVIETYMRLATEHVAAGKHGAAARVYTAVAEVYDQIADTYHDRSEEAAGFRQQAADARSLADAEARAGS
jgi:tetratricopeptide (TPR) repeat protein